MRILITGDRDWDDKRAIRKIITLCLPGFREVEAKHALTVIHGDCPTGADHIADKICKEFHIPVMKFPANWKKYGKAAGPRRNSKMLKEKPDMVIGFHNDIRKSKGTRDMLKKAKVAGIQTLLISTEFQ